MLVVVGGMNRRRGTRGVIQAHRFGPFSRPAAFLFLLLPLYLKVVALIPQVAVVFSLSAFLEHSDNGRSWNSPLRVRYER